MSMKALRELNAIRILLTGSISLITLAILIGSKKYPHVWALNGAIIYLILYVIVAASYFMVAWLWSRSKMFADCIAFQQGLIWGGILSGLWLTEIIIGNFSTASQIWVILIYRGASLMAFAAPLFAGLIGAQQSGQVRTGILIGFWAGLLNGAWACLVLAVIGLFFNDFLQHDSQTLSEFARSGAPDLPTYIFGDYLAGGINHLWLIGPALGSLFSTLGGIVGASFSRQRIPSKRQF